MFRSLVALVMLIPAGCYRYAPGNAGDMQAGMGVRARVTAATAEQIQPLLGVIDARVLAGTIVAASAETLLVEVPTVARSDEGVRNLRQRVAIPRASLLEIERRELDRTRTGLVAAGVAAAAGVFIAGTLRSDPGREGTPPPPGGGDIRLGLRISVP